MGYNNPVPGYVHPKGWVRPGGNVEFTVTRTCADHRATGQGCALDLGNARCDGKVFSVSAGTVAHVDPVQGIVRIDAGGGHVYHYAHMYPVLVAKGATVAVQQQIGEVGDAHDPAVTNFSGCHLHFGHTVNGVEVDPAPLINQLLGGSDDMDASYQPIPNRTVIVNAGARHRLAPTLDPANIAIAADPGGKLAFPLAGTVKGAPAGGSDLWYVYWHDDVNKWYYLHTTVCGAMVPWEASVSDCAPAVSAAVAPVAAKVTALEKEVAALTASKAAMKVKTGAFAADIADD